MCITTFVHVPAMLPRGWRTETAQELYARVDRSERVAEVHAMEELIRRAEPAIEADPRNGPSSPKKRNWPDQGVLHPAVMI